MQNKIQSAYLAVAGVVMSLVGGYIAIATNGYFTTMSQLTPMPAIDLLSDLRGMGGLLLTFGLYIISTAFVARWRAKALWLAMVIYLNFVIFRLLSFVVDGTPSDAVLVAFSIEFVLGLVGAWVSQRLK